MNPHYFCPFHPDGTNQGTAPRRGPTGEWAIMEQVFVGRYCGGSNMSESFDADETLANLPERHENT